jgi:hypothetical protein
MQRFFTLFTLFLFIISFGFHLSSCKNNDEEPNVPTKDEKDSTANIIEKRIRKNDIEVDVVIDKPQGTKFDVLVVFRGTLRDDSKILDAAYKSLDRFKALLDRNDLMVVSVAYPEENLLFGDNVEHSLVALKWLKSEASKELKIDIGKIFLAGHSQGGYIATRLNTIEKTDGVIANAPGPLNLLFRCRLEEDGKIPEAMECTLLRNNYGSTDENPEAYQARSLLRFTKGYKADLLVIQGMDDSPIYMNSWPMFKTRLENCSDCKQINILELEDMGHSALFQSEKAKKAFNDFLRR